MHAALCKREESSFRLSALLLEEKPFIFGCWRPFKNTHTLHQTIFWRQCFQCQGNHCWLPCYFCCPKHNQQHQIKPQIPAIHKKKKIKCCEPGCDQIHDSAFFVRSVHVPLRPVCFKTNVDTCSSMHCAYILHFTMCYVWLASVSTLPSVQSFILVGCTNHQSPS